MYVICMAEAIDMTILSTVIGYGLCQQAQHLPLYIGYFLSIITVLLLLTIRPVNNRSFATIDKWCIDQWETL